MTKAEEKRREKARALRYRKPAVKDLNISEILIQLTEIEEECAEVHWYCDSEDGWDTLLNALDGIVKPGDRVLVKASHSMAFEEIVEKLTK